MEANVIGDYIVDATGDIVLTSESGIQLNAKDAISMKSEESKIDILAEKDVIVKSGEKIKLN